MSRFVAIGAVLVLLGCPGAALEAGQADAFAAAHNAVRASPDPQPASPLPALTFDDGLAAIAQQWSVRCVFEHSEEPLGENLAFFSGDGSTPEEVVGAWASEDAFYDYDANACAADQDCGHYTQIVWRETERVGCGASPCTIDGFDGVFWVCNYDPPGNFVGERPY